MVFGSVCSGIEAASVAWKPIGWSPAFFSEIEKFPCAVLKHHYPETPNHGDMTKFNEWPDATLDVLIGGTPCQSFSVAGLRKGLADPRGNLALTYLAVADRYRPRWLVWENVPGVLSSSGGRDFGAFLGALGQLGYGFAYRVLDAQYFGVAQRRRRVFVVGHLGDWTRAAAVLFERESLQGHPAPRREAGEGIAPSLAARTKGGRGVERTGESRGQDPVIAMAINAKGESGRMDGESETFVAHTLKADGFDASEDGTGRGTPIIAEPYTIMERGRNDGQSLEYRNDGTANAILTPNGGRGGMGVGAIAFDCKQSGQGGEIAPPLRAMNHNKSHENAGGQLAVAFAQNSRDELREMPYVGSLAAQPGMKQTSYIRSNMAVRRLTPRECERLQGFPDDYTKIPWRNKPADQCPDGPRYKALGNSMAVPVIRWIGKRIEMIETL